MACPIQSGLVKFATPAHALASRSSSCGILTLTVLGFRARAMSWSKNGKYGLDAAFFRLYILLQSSQSLA
jgi:hypothetical protein